MKNFPLRSGVLYTLSALALVWLIFQLFLRYQYVGEGNFLTRIDRLSGASCRLDDCNYYWSLGPPQPVGPPPGWSKEPVTSGPPPGWSKPGVGPPPGWPSTARP
jgi:hypothetical protein